MKDMGGWFPDHNLCVKNRQVGLALVLLTAIPFFLFRATGNNLLKDSDTNFLLFKLNEHNNPWRWFTHDWPLENHFYRPISTLVFELDNRLHPGDGSAFGLTNAILCFLSVLGLYWLVCELRRSIGEAVAVSWLWASWLLSGWFLGKWWGWIAVLIPWVVLGAVLVRSIKSGKFTLAGIAAVFATFFTVGQLWPSYDNLSAHTMYWLPGRTATTMAVFSLIAFAAYVRFETYGQPRTQPEPTPLDPPATRSATETALKPKQIGWLLLSLLCTVIAMASYEQAVMMPAAIFVLGIWLRMDGYRCRFAHHVWFWSILVAYIVYRVQIIPIQASGYQKQQFRDGPGVILDLVTYLFPGGLTFHSAYVSLSSGILVLLSEPIWSNLFYGVSNVATWYTLRKQWVQPVLCILAAALLFGPMAFLKQFGHYHFLPSAFMAFASVLMLSNVLKVAFTEALPQAIQAPQRSDRAPGSLPHL